MAYYITATSERGKPVTKYGTEYVHIIVERDRNPSAVIHIKDGHMMVHCWQDGQSIDAHSFYLSSNSKKEPCTHEGQYVYSTINGPKCALCDETNGDR